LTAAVDKKRFHEPDVRSFALDDFIQFLGPAIWNISRFLIIGGTKLMSDVAIGLSDPNVSELAFKELAGVFVEAIFTEVANIVTSISLDAESFKNIKNLFDRAMSLKHDPKSIFIDQQFLEARTRNFWRSLIMHFHKEYSKRLDTSLKTKEWKCVPAEWEHIEILRDLSGLKIRSFTLNGCTHEASPPVLILLELVCEYLEMAQEMTLVRDKLAVAIFECIRLFGDSISKERTVTLQTLALLSSGVSLCIELIPLIKSKLIKMKAPEDLVDQYSSEATKALKASYGAVMKRIENECSSSARTESDGADPNAHIASDRLRTFVPDSLMDGIRAQMLEP
jgi:hypothetical protein